MHLHAGMDDCLLAVKLFWHIQLDDLLQARTSLAFAAAMLSLFGLFQSRMMWCDSKVGQVHSGAPNVWRGVLGGSSQTSKAQGSFFVDH